MIAPRQGPPRTDRSSRRRDEIVAASRSVFEAQGYFDTRVADIVKSIGVSHGTFYTYFSSKDDVLKVLVDEMADALLAVSTRPAQHYDEPFLALEATIRQFVNAYSRWAGLLRILEQAMAYNPEFLGVRQGIRRRFSSQLESVIRRHQARYPDPDGLDANLAAYALGGMVDDFAHGKYLLGHAVPDEDAVVTLSIIWVRAIGLGGFPAQAKPLRIEASCEHDAEGGEPGSEGGEPGSEEETRR